MRFISHLDIQRLLHRAFRRAGVPIAYSQGFNPHPQLSFATALSTGFTSSAEWLDVKLEKDMAAEDFLRLANGALPEGFRLLEAHAAEEKLPTLTALLAQACYTLTFAPDTDASALESGMNALLSGPVVVEKRTKGGIKPVDIRPQVLSAKFSQEAENLAMTLTGVLNASGSLNIELLMGALREKTGMDYEYSVHRDCVMFANGRSTPV